MIENDIDEDPCHGHINPHRPGESSDFAMRRKRAGRKQITRRLPGLKGAPEGEKHHRRHGYGQNHVADQQYEISRPLPPRAGKNEDWRGEMVHEVTDEKDSRHGRGR